MSVVAKKNLVHDVEEDIGEFLTVVQTRKVASSLEAHLDEYEVEPVKVTDISMDLIQRFINAKSADGRAESTLKQYGYTLEKIVKSIGIPIEKITTDDLRAYIREEKNRGMSDGYVEGMRNVLSSFFGWLWRENLIKTNPCGNLSAMKCEQKMKYVYSSVELEKLKNGCTNVRDKALVLFMWSTGARIAEVCTLNRSDIDFQNMQCTVYGKGRKERTVYMNDVAAEALKEYLATRTDSFEALFVPRKRNGYYERRLEPHGVRYFLTQLSKRTGVPNVHPHRFRRTLATHLIDLGMPIQEVSMILGHENINTTMKYYCVDKEKVKNSYRRFMQG